MNILLLTICVAALRPGGDGVVYLGHKRSPDGRIDASCAMGEAEVGYLTLTKGRRALLKVTATEGFQWLARRPAALVYATDGLYGRANLWLWTERSGPFPLLKVKEPTDRSFRLVSVKRIGKKYRIRYLERGAEETIDRFRPTSIDLPLSKFVALDKARPRKGRANGL